jgi:HEAT repeat protein
MSVTKIIPFQRRERLLSRARGYVENIEAFVAERDMAVPCLLEALPVAEGRLLHTIVLLLGSFAKREVVYPFRRMMRDRRMREETRHALAVQLSVMLPHLRPMEGLIEALLGDLEDADPSRRLCAALALGWKGNDRAALSLVNLLYDPDGEVQQAAVIALCNMEDDRVLNLMLERLTHAPPEQKRTILFNLWRFSQQRDEVSAVYRRLLEDPDPALRLDALVLLGAVADPDAYASALLECLADREAAVRCLALEQIAELEIGLGNSELERIRPLAADRYPAVRSRAITLIKRHLLRAR